ncbi:MAG: class I SAM-dependent methyltransferase [Candidatus Nanoarchaeia archaeon]|nr:class I SAM-dependent methyltransferase [Candidatus Nanoarchaeia archaeon]
MPSIEKNREMWGKNANWEGKGEEWSRNWGGTPYIWAGTVLPRIIQFVPCETIVEIAPGYGRFTQYLRKLCKRLIIVDLNKNCIDECKKRFCFDKKIIYLVNDGRTLKGIPDNSVDFIFSWDSLVHCEEDVIKSYLFESKRVLKFNGRGLFHHSNYGIFNMEFNKHCFSNSMTAEKFIIFCKEAGIFCNYQEIIDQDKDMQACLSFFTKTDKYSKTKIFNNKEFYKEVNNLRRISESCNPANY